MGGSGSPRRLSVFFFQAEDGIRDVAVTGVQTCALPISGCSRPRAHRFSIGRMPKLCARATAIRSDSRRCAKRDRKSTRLNSSHGYISYAVFCLKKKKQRESLITPRDYILIPKIRYWTTD